MYSIRLNLIDRYYFSGCEVKNVAMFVIGCREDKRNNLLEKYFKTKIFSDSSEFCNSFTNSSTSKKKWAQGEKWV